MGFNLFYTLFLSLAVFLSTYLVLPNLLLAQDTITCDDDPNCIKCDGDLNPADNNSKDLLVAATCNVKAGEHMYRYVNIINNGVLNFVDEGAATDFWAKSILVENGGTLKAGEPSMTGAFGAAGGTLTIYLYGSNNDSSNNDKHITCKSSDDMCGASAVWNLNSKDTINPTSCTESMMPDGEMECFYNYIDPTNPSDDYFGKKVLAVSYGGIIEMYGSKGASSGTLESSNSGTSWVRLAGNLNPSDSASVFNVNRSVDWREGDFVVVTTTDYLPGHSEKLKITKRNSATQFEYIVVNPHTNNKISDKVKYPHNGTAYPLNKVPTRVGLDIKVDGQPAVETRAAVGLLTRNIRVVSGGSTAGEMFGAPTPGNHFGGHVMFRQGAKRVHIQGVEFYQLGQGGIKGRYPVHLHLMRKTASTNILDNSIHDSMTRFITIHGTHGAMLARNVGYMSIGHGYYLEDGTEINNKLYSNLGVLARAAVKDSPNSDPKNPKGLNPREVPGILAADTDPANVNILTAVSDYIHPTVFWLTNGWNYIEYNMAAGATACGACFWPANVAISGPSRRQHWESYASIKPRPGRLATAPIKRFKGNYCTTAMNSYNATTDTSACLGVGQGGSVQIKPIKNPLAPPVPPPCIPNDPNPKPNLTLDKCVENEFYYPAFSKNPNATRCSGTDCSAVRECSGGIDRTTGKANVDNCAVTVLDRYTSSFNWTETNFSAIWLRRAFFTVINSAITDVQGAGVTFVTGGDYTQSSLLPGSFMLAANNVFIGNTQKGNPFSSNAGPFSKGGLSCENSTVNYCVDVNEGISMPLTGFAMNQRLFNIYDGPANQSSNAFLDIKKTHVTDCTLDKKGNCFDSSWMYGRIVGIPRDVKESVEGNNVSRDVQNTCILPNAAIAWKQPNGFYYPPAFHSDNLFFDNVDIRHFVIQPLFETGTFITDENAVRGNYCTYTTERVFQNWTAIDRQTILNDDDGSLTGVEKTISVNEDSFFTAPIEQFECRSDATAKTSPYQYVTTVVYPDCGTACNGEIWNPNCTVGCYGVPLIRQYLTGTEDANSPTEIRMQGPGIAGRINLTANNGLYYIDTTRNDAQKTFPLRNIFEKNRTYYTFFIFATPEIKQKYQIYVGKDKDINETQIVNAVTANLETIDVGFDSISWESTGWKREYNSDTGILTVTVDMKNFEKNFAEARIEGCRPSSFCEPSGSKCICSKTLATEDPKLFDQCKRIDICRWSGNDPDCPVFDETITVSENGMDIKKTIKVPRCLGFGFTMTGNFEADDDPSHRPDLEPFPNEMGTWNVDWNQVGESLAGKECVIPKFPKPNTNFADGTNGEANMSRNVIRGTPADDVLKGTMGPDLIQGLEGNDTIIGRGGDDILEGGPGNDIIDGKSGNDLIFGGEGNDDIRGGKGHDDIHGEAGDDTIRGGVGNDDITGGDGNDLLRGQNGNDELYGNSGDDMVEGNRGADYIDGGPGDDVLMGQGGWDEIYGGPGDDMIEGGDGMDDVDGGPGVDTCIQSENTDCESSQ